MVVDSCVVVVVEVAASVTTTSWGTWPDSELPKLSCAALGEVTAMLMGPVVFTREVTSKLIQVPDAMLLTVLAVVPMAGAFDQVIPVSVQLVSVTAAAATLPEMEPSA